MKCCRCNTEFTKKDKVCPGCGIQLKEIKRIIYMSNGVYNSALEKAKGKDLTGARIMLKKCLELNKRHTDARNLYGLILYRLGDFTEAAKQWNINIALTDDKRAAELYKKAFGNKGERAKINQAISNYNHALHCAYEGSDDLTLVYLKKTIANYPYFAKAVRLMAITCMIKKDYARACRVLEKYLKVNANDTDALRYYDEAKKLAGNTLDDDIEEQIEREERESQDVIIPKYSEKKELLHDLLCIFGGIALGILASMFLIFPSVKQKMIDENNNAIMSYGEDLTYKDVKIIELEGNIKSLNEKLKTTEAKLKKYTADDGIIAAYTNLITAISSYYSEANYIDGITAFNKINSKAVSDEVYKKAYDMMKSDIETKGVATLENEGMKYYKRYDFTNSTKYFTQCLKINSDNPKVMYYLGLSYYNSDDKDNAKKWFYKIQKDYAGTSWARYSKRLMPYTPESTADTNN